MARQAGPGIILVIITMVAGVSLGGEDANAQNRRNVVPAHICSPGAEPIYSCRYGRRAVSICNQGGQLSYHFGRSARARELTIPAGSGNRNMHYGNVIGQGGGHQEHLRFSNAGTEYIIFNGHNGALSDDPDYRYSGLAVMRGTRQISYRTCSAPTVGRNGQSWSLPRGLPRETEDSIYDGWF